MPADSSRLPDIKTVISIIHTLVGEVHPKWKHLRFTPDTQLERELGLDSMARMELRVRINETLGISLDERTAICACTPNDLMQAIRIQAGQVPPPPPESEDQVRNARDPGTLLMGGFTGKCGKVTPARPHYTLREWFYAFYTWPLFIGFGLLSWVLVVFTPFRSWRRKLAHLVSGLFFKLAFTPIRVTGHEYLHPDKPQILVGNHSSYLDGFIITAALDVPLRFIVKGELSRILPVRLILQRFGVEFVDRFNPHRGTGTVRRMAEKSRRGHTLFFFPEGTFASFHGLQPFRMGAFVAAARSGVPVVPVAIRGARDIVRGDRWFPRHGRIEVIVRPPVPPGGDTWQDALAVRDAARREISAWCGEPDLVEIDSADTPADGEDERQRG